MTHDIHSTVFAPERPGEPYVVVASVFPYDLPLEARLRCQRRELVRSSAEAATRCCELASALRGLLEQYGRAVGRIHCTHCPSVASPECGELAAPALAPH